MFSVIRRSIDGGLNPVTEKLCVEEDMVAKS